MLERCGLFGKDIHETFVNAKIDRHNKRLYNFLQHEWDRKSWLYVQSIENGTGKSYTANAIANMLIDDGTQPLVIREVDMAEQLQATFADDTGETEYALMGRWKSVPMLIIQDLGKYGCKSEWWPQHIYNIIDYRIIKGLPMVITSNYNIEDKKVIETRFGENHGPAIQSRLVGVCRTGIWIMDGPDRRCA